MIADSNIWSNNIRLIKKTSEPEHMAGLGVGADTNQYLYNSHGYRSPEFIKNPKLLVSGCSMTFGEGVPEEATWGRFVSSKLGAQESYVNLGIRGASVGQIILNIFAYIREYGAPEYLLCLLPDFKRIEFVLHKNIIYDEYGAKSKSDFEGHDVLITRTHLHHKNFIPPKYIKSPAFLQDVIPLEYAIFQSTGYIDMLTTYCQAAGIKFLWSTWDYDLADECSSRNYSCYLDIVSNHNASDLNNPKSLNCHLDLFDRYKDNFHNGLDEAPHWGVHKHAHMADLFLSALD